MQFQNEIKTHKVVFSFYMHILLTWHKVS